MRLLLATTILTLFSPAVLAETVYYCSTDQRAILDKSNISTQPNRFKMLMEAFVNEEMFTATEILDVGEHRLTFAISFFKDKTFTYSNIGDGEASTIIASCDKF